MLCPGCKATHSFYWITGHFSVCLGVCIIGYAKNGVIANFKNPDIVATRLATGMFRFHFKKDLLDTMDQINSKIFICNLNNTVFAVQMKMANGNFCFPVLMLAEREKCERFQVTIEIQDSKHETAFLDQFNPVPLDMENSDEASLVVHRKRFARKVTDGDMILFALSIKVSEKRSIDDY